MIALIYCPVFDLIKSSDNICWPRVHMFNDAIADMELREIHRVGARYTWTNHQLNLIHSVLDRVLVSANWELAYPMSALKAITRISSDHTPLFFSSGEELTKRNPRFFLELGWFEEEGFLEQIKAKWAEAGTAPFSSRGVLDMWHQCSSKLWQFLHGWGGNRGRDASILQVDMLQQIVWLDSRADSLGLYEGNWQRCYILDNSIIKLYRAEEIY